MSSSLSPKRNYTCGCSCEVCHCGPNCKCTETLCRCEASSVLNSLQSFHSVNDDTTNNNNVGSEETGLGSRNNNRTQQHRSRSPQQPQSSCCSKAAETETTTTNGDSGGGSSIPDGTTKNEETTIGSNDYTMDHPVKNNNNNNAHAINIGVSGMTCSMCTKSVEEAVKAVPGVTSVSVSLALQEAHIEYDSTLVSKTDLMDTIEAVGYDVIPFDNDNDEDGMLLEQRDIETAGGGSPSIVDITVSGMTCSMCTQSVQRAMVSTDGVIESNVTLSTNTAHVVFDSTKVTLDELREAIEDIGYDVVDTAFIETTTMTNANGGTVRNSPPVTEDRLQRLLKQQQQEVNNRKRAFIWSSIGTIPILFITMVLSHFPSSTITKFLHRTVPIRIGTQTHDFVLEALLLWALCTPIQFGCGWPFYKSTYFGLRHGVMGMDVLVAVGTTASYGYAVWATFTPGSMEYHFFETSAVLICFVLLGKWMQTMAVRRTSQALTHLLQLQPKTAIKIVPDVSKTSHTGWNPLNNDPYTEEIVPVTLIETGDYVKVLKGASIPADGIIRFGEMTVDESMITGESIPVLKTKGSVVLGGTICSESSQDAGASFVQVTGVGSSTALSQILQLVQDAQNRQVPIQNLADTIAGIFVPSVVMVSLITFMTWYALVQSEIVPAEWLPEGESPSTFSLLFGISCLVISCPCALGLATPTAVMVGTGQAAKQGVLMKGGETLELASQVDSIIFDKTGTLTVAKPTITDFEVVVSDDTFWSDVLGTSKGKINSDFEGMPTKTTEACLLWLLGSLERNSEHLLATAVVEYATKVLGEHETAEEAEGVSSTSANSTNESFIDFAQPSNFVALTGRGASGTILGKIEVSVGNRAFCEIQKFSIDQLIESSMQRLERQGKTAIVAAVNGHIVCVLGIADQLKPDAIASIKYLKEELSVDVWMVTGDNRRTARAIARQLQLPFDRVVAEALPVAKVEKVQELQSLGKVVAMIGDGVNDSPALVQADVGLSIGTGAEIAAEASDMVLVRGNVADVCTALDLSRVIFRRIQMNLMWSLIYNCLSIPLAAGVFYPFIRARLPPTVAALAMALSSVSVVASSLALRLYRPPDICSQQQQRLPGSSRPNRRSRRTMRPSEVMLSSSGPSSSEEALREPLLARRSTQQAGNLSSDRLNSLEEGRGAIVDEE